MNPSFILPDETGFLLLIFGAIAVVVYLKATIDDIKATRREKAIREFNAAVKADKVSRRLADYYTAAAYGDPDDFEYWMETAELFEWEQNFKADETR